MGLEMYLYKHTYVKNFGHLPPEYQHEITVKKGGVVRSDIKSERISYIIEEVASWRKFNALHGWFVNECANGVDKCQKIFVEDEKLNELLELCKKVKSIIEELHKKVKILKDWDGTEYEHEVYECEETIKGLLPPVFGHFFGFFEVDDRYKQQINETVTIIEGLLQEHEESKQHGH